MRNVLSLLLVLAPPPEADVQGLYEGTCGDVKLEARVVATGKMGYKVFVRQALPDGKVGKVDLEGKTEGDAVGFKGGDWSAAYEKGAIQGTCGAAKVQLKRVERKPPSLGKKPPAGAIVLLDGKDFSRLSKGKGKDGAEQDWAPGDDGSIQVPKGGMNSVPQMDGSFDLHVEFMCPLMPAARDQGRGNSGCYLPNGDEIQVLDSFGMTTYTGGGCGGLYKYKDPDAFDAFSLASLPPLQWQTYDVEYRVGKPAGKPKVTVLHNGIKIHDGFELQKDARKGGFQFQDHGNPVRYRNIWVVPLEGK